MRHKLRIALAALAAPVLIAGLGLMSVAPAAATATAHPVLKGIRLHLHAVGHGKPKITIPRSKRPPGNAPLGSGNLTWHGGPVQTDPQVAVIFWGLWWSSTCTNQQGNGGGDEAYLLNELYPGLATTSDNMSPVDSQYFGPVGNYPIFPTVAGKALIAANVFCSNPPASATDAQLASVAAAYADFLRGNGYTVTNNTQIVVVSPSGTNPGGGFGTQYCAYHNWVSYAANAQSGLMSWTNLPYMPDAGANCGANIIQNADNGWSIVGGHEYNESVTDPFVNNQSAWYDAAGFENGDKCAWTNIFVQKLSTGSIAMQPEWDNRTSSCRSASTYPHGQVKLSSNTTFCLSAAVTSGSTVQLFSPCDTAFGRTFVRYPDASLRRWRNTAECITPLGGAAVSGTKLVMNRCTGATYQQWFYSSTSQHWTNGNGLCLKASSVASGATMREATCSSTSSLQRFSNV